VSWWGRLTNSAPGKMLNRTMTRIGKTHGKRVTKQTMAWNPHSKPQIIHANNEQVLKDKQK